MIFYVKPPMKHSKMLLFSFFCTFLPLLVAAEPSYDEYLHTPLRIDTDSFALQNYRHILDALDLAPTLLPAPVLRFSLSSFTPFCNNYAPPEVADDVVPECVRWEVSCV